MRFQIGIAPFPVGISPISRRGHEGPALIVRGARPIAVTAVHAIFGPPLQFPDKFGIFRLGRHPPGFVVEVVRPDLGNRITDQPARVAAALFDRSLIVGDTLSVWNARVRYAVPVGDGIGFHRIEGDIVQREIIRDHTRQRTVAAPGVVEADHAAPSEIEPGVVRILGQHQLRLVARSLDGDAP